MSRGPVSKGPVSRGPVSPGPVSTEPLSPGRAGLGGPAGGMRRVLIRDLVLLGAIGIHPHEHGRTQRVRINLRLDVPDDPRATAPGPDRLERVVDYEQVAEAVRRLVAQGHTKLVETLAERIAACCLQDARVQAVYVRVEKLDVFADVASVGVEIERRR